MGIGILTVRVVVDDPQRIRYGPYDPITGHVSLTFKPTSDGKNAPIQELFAPLELNLVFSGRAKTKIYKRKHNMNGSHTVTYRGRAPLFETTTPISHGKLTLAVGQEAKFPFRIFFPDRAIRSGIWEETAIFAGGEHALPPTINCENDGFLGNFIAFTEYTLVPQVQVRNIDLDIHLPLNDMRVHYGRPRIPSAHVDRTFEKMLHPLRISNAMLLEEPNRPHGFKAKTKAFFSPSNPTFAANIHIAMPVHWYIGQPVNFSITSEPIHTVHTDRPVEVVPEVTLESYRLQVSSHLVVRAEGNIFSGNVTANSSEDNVINFTGGSNEPFSQKSNWTQNFTSNGLLFGVVEAFATYNIALRYSVTVRVTLRAAGESAKFTSSMKIWIHPPIDDSPSQPGSSAATATALPPNVVAGPGTVRQGVEEQLPAYGAAPPSYPSVVAKE